MMIELQYNWCFTSSMKHLLSSRISRIYTHSIAVIENDSQPIDFISIEFEMRNFRISAGAAFKPTIDEIERGIISFFPYLHYENYRTRTIEISHPPFKVDLVSVYDDEYKVDVGVRFRGPDHYILISCGMMPGTLTAKSNLIDFGVFEPEYPEAEYVFCEISPKDALPDS
jgi:hypothetical protein